jgi:hypothetical protein
MFTLKSFSVGSYQGLKISLKIKRPKTTSYPSSLEKPQRILKSKPPLQN